MGEGEKEEEHTGGQQPHSLLPARAETRKGQMEGIQLPQARHKHCPQGTSGEQVTLLGEHTRGLFESILYKTHPRTFK